MKRHLPWCVLYVLLFFANLYYAFNGVIEWFRPVNVVVAALMIAGLLLEVTRWQHESRYER